VALSHKFAQICAAAERHIWLKCVTACTLLYQVQGRDPLGGGMIGNSGIARGGVEWL